MNRAAQKPQIYNHVFQKRTELNQILVDQQQLYVISNQQNRQLTNKPYVSCLEKNLQVKNPIRKENKPPIQQQTTNEIKSAKSNSSARDDQKKFSKEDILNRIKKLNNKNNESSHIRYKSSVNHPIRNTSLTFHQIMKEYSQKSNSSRLNQNPNQNLLQKYGNKDIIYEEPSPFQEQKPDVLRATSAQEMNENNLKEKKVEMQHLLLQLCKENQQTDLYFQKQNQGKLVTNIVNIILQAEMKTKMLAIHIHEQELKIVFSNISIIPFYEIYIYSSNESVSSRRNQLNSTDQGINKMSNKLAAQLKENKSLTNNIARYQQQRGGYLTVKQIEVNPIKTVGNIDQIQKSLENLCVLTQQQLNFMQETKQNLLPNTQYRKSAQRCISADINLIKPIDCKSNQSFINSNTANDNQLQMDLICEEEVKIDEESQTKQNQQPIMQEQQPDTSSAVFDSSTIAYLCERERRYLPDPHYLQTKQQELNWTMRAILLDWMMEVSSEFHLKRETFYLSINYVDRYLSKVSVAKSNLQLIGLTSMLMASKVEEIIPQKVNNFARAADYGYSVEQILEMELKILQINKWEINPPTMNLWLNWYMGQWDLFFSKKDPSWCGFKQSSEDSFQYKVFKKLTQLIDCAVLDIETLQYQPRTIVASFLYLVIAFKLEIYPNDMIDEFKKSSLFLLDQSNQFNLIFDEFIRTTFGFYLYDLLPSIQYASTYLRLVISNDTPPGVATLANTPLESNYEEFLSFQCHVPLNLDFVQKRPRDESNIY